MDTDCSYADLLYQQLHIPTNILNSMHKTSWDVMHVGTYGMFIIYTAAEINNLLFRIR